MTARRVPGIEGQAYRTVETVQDGTGGAFANFAPGALGATPRVADDLLGRFDRAVQWLDVEPVMVSLLGPSSFTCGVAAGIGTGVLNIAVDLVALVKTLALAELGDTRIVRLSREYSLDQIGWINRAVRALDAAREERDALIEGLRYIFTHPGEIFENLKQEHIEKWQRFEALNCQATLSSRYEAGKIFGELLLVVLGLIGGGAALVKLVSRLPKLAALVPKLKRAASALRSRGSGSAASRQTTTPASPGRATTTRKAEPEKPAAPQVRRSLDDPESLKGAKPAEVEALIPEDWIKSPQKKGEGTRYLNPHRRGEAIIVEKGWPQSPDPLHQGPYARISRNGQVVRIPLEGNPTLK